MTIKTQTQVGFGQIGVTAQNATLPSLHSLSIGVTTYQDIPGTQLTLTAGSYVIFMSCALTYKCGTPNTAVYEMSASLFKLGVEYTNFRSMALGRRDAASSTTREETGCAFSSGILTTASTIEINIGAALGNLSAVTFFECPYAHLTAIKTG